MPKIDVEDEQARAKTRANIQEKKLNILYLKNSKAVVKTKKSVSVQTLAHMNEWVYVICIHICSRPADCMFQSNKPNEFSSFFWWIRLINCCFALDGLSTCLLARSFASLIYTSSKRRRSIVQTSIVPKTRHTSKYLNDFSYSALFLHIFSFCNECTKSRINGVYWRLTRRDFILAPNLPS